MIKGRKENDNITLLNTSFVKKRDPKKETINECLTLVYKDCDTGRKFKEEIINPDYEYFIANEDNRVSYPRLFIEKEKVQSVKVPYRNLEKDIASRLKMLDYFYENIRNGNRIENRKLHTHPDIFNSDMNIEDHYRYRFDKLYKNEPFIPTKSFFDIEADTINMMGDFPEPGECPINAISLIFQETKEIYVFLLRNKSNPQIQEFENAVNSGQIFSEFSAFLTQAVGPELVEKYCLHFKYKFLFYDEEDEINLIRDLFVAINHNQPDFVLAWNMGFDMPYIISRILKLGYDPGEIITHPDFKNRTCLYFVDERMKSEFAERGDFAAISSYSVFLDQMIHFASRRKGQNKFISFSLDFIGEVVAKVKKLDYKNITTNLSELPYKDYKTFVFYNIMDTIVQYCIEYMTEDINYVFNKCTMNNTRYSKCHRQTVYLTNRGTKEFWIGGYVIGNNVNKFNPPPDKKFAGAYVADPLKVSDKYKFKIYGNPIAVFDNCVDYDYRSLYPSEYCQNNIAANTQIGRVIIKDKIHSKENLAFIDSWTREGQFMEDLQSHVWLEFASRWLHLADYTTLYREVEDFYTTIASPYYGLKYHTNDGLTIPMVFDKVDTLVTPMIFEDDIKMRKIENMNFIYHNNSDWERWRENAIKHPNQLF